jgi:hypothetical protein
MRRAQGVGRDRAGFRRGQGILEFVEGEQDAHPRSFRETQAGTSRETCSGAAGPGSVRALDPYRPLTAVLLLHLHPVVGFEVPVLAGVEGVSTGNEEVGVTRKRPAGADVADDALLQVLP